MPRLLRCLFVEIDKAAMEHWFIYVGLAVIFLGPLTWTVPNYREHKEKNECDKIVRELNDAREWETGSRPLYDWNKMAGARKLLVSYPWRRREILALMTREELGLLVKHLEHRPAKYRYDLEHIELLGVVKNYLKALDLEESEGILEKCPEQREDKSC